MNKRLITMTSALALCATMAFAQVTPETLAAQYRSQGYTSIDIRVGPTQIKVEAVRGNDVVETVYDAATGRVLDRDFYTLDSNGVVRDGVRMRDVGRDFESRDDNGRDTRDDDGFDTRDDGTRDDGTRDDDTRDDDGDTNDGDRGNDSGNDNGNDNGNDDGNSGGDSGSDG